MCDAKILSQKGTSVVSRCSECQCLFIWHHNLILSFTPDQFIQFKNFAIDLDFGDHSFPFPDGQERVVMRTPVNDIQLTFTVDEWEDFHASMDEAIYMQEIYAMVEGGK
ncbi:DUF6686 family protein [Mucilaginibacter sp. Mucisp86]|uniref:DUF6686 family protein n=1 Tax=Mucilaginibacter sp. Mucisp86 TaxID=3243060 RepID=UPI000D9F56E5